MKLSFSTLGCPRWSWNEIIATAKDLGYDGVEVRGLQQDIFVPRARTFQTELARTKAQLQRTGLEIPCLSSACDLFNPARVEANLQECRDYIDLAVKLGAPYIRVLGDWAPQASDMVDESLLIQNCRLLGSEAQAAGVTLLLESNGVFAETERLAELLRRIDNPGVAALWDLHHPYRFFGEKPEQSWKNLAPWLRHVHVKDSVMEKGHVAYRMLGNGDIPVKAAVAALQDGGYEGFYSLEWVKRWNAALEEPGIVFAQYLHAMRG